jgi:hypothetical protein
LVFGNHLSPDLLAKVRNELLEWNRTEAGFLMSHDALRAFYSIRDALALPPAHRDGYSRSQRKGVWTCKNRFRGLLKTDLNLLYQEEQAPD